MALINRVFNGKMNLDASPYRMPQQDYNDALNITRDAEGAGNDRVVSNINGNDRVLYSLPAGTNKRIGSFAFPLRNVVYYFIWNSNGYNLWLYYDRATDTITKLIEDLTDTDNIPVLDFDPSYRINHICVYPRDDEGDLVLWTDGHTTPKKANVKHILEAEYTTVKSAFIELAKMPPLSPPTGTYGNDATKTANALRRKLFQFGHRWKYDDFELSSVSPYSKVPLPIGIYGSDNDLDSSNNNFISIDVETGDEDVSDIEILMRSNIGNAWSDFVLVASLNKEQLNIPDNDSYQFLFYNDALYPPVINGIQYADGVQIIPLFDYVPQLCDCLVLANGNVPVAAAITEGYDNYPTNELDVTMTVENVLNEPPDADPMTITYENLTTYFTFTVNGTPREGDTAKIYIFFNGTPPSQTYGVRLVGDYVVQSGDTADDVASALYNDFNSYSSVPVITGSYGGTNSWNSIFGAAGTYVFSVQVVLAPPSVSAISTEKTWLWQAQYIFGLVYEDDQNRDMPGVTTFTDPTDPDNDFAVNTPAFSEAGGVPETPVISATINHLPPDESVKYNWVRRRQTFGSFLFYMTAYFQDDPDGDGYLFFCLDNITKYKEANSQFIYGAAPVTPESRIKVIAGVTGDAYNGDLWTQDYQIIGVVEKTITGGSSPDDDRLFIKVKKPIAAISPAYTDNMLVMVYTPAVNPTSLNESVYWEWAENYGIYEGYTITYSGLTGTFEIGETITGGTSGATAIITGDDATQLGISDLVGEFEVGETITGGTSGATATVDTISDAVNYHRGSDQDQTSFQPATFTFEEGDVYYRQREMYSGILGTPPYTNISTVALMDANYSDYFDSAVNDNGRAHVINVNAGYQYNPVLARFGQEYQSGTNLNGMNKFFFENQDIYDLSWGSIVKLFIDRRYMYVFHQFNTGVVPVLTQIVKDVAGNPLEANSDILLNKITYPYDKQFGLGNVPESFAYTKSGMIGWDNNKGVLWRLAQNGMIALSVLYECNAFFVSKSAAYQDTLNNGNPPNGGVYTGNPTGYGVFDSFTNKYIIALEEINRYNAQGYLTFHQDPYTIVFLEDRGEMEGFETFTSCHPEGFESLNNLLIAFKDGEFWKHDSDTYCNFFGVQYNAYIQGIFNDNTLQKKTWESLTQMTDIVWECPIIYTNVMSYGTQRQESVLIPEDFTIYEQYPSTSFLRDSYSIGGLINGDWLKGAFVVIRFQRTDASSLVILSGVSVMYKDSPLTTV